MMRHPGWKWTGLVFWLLVMGLLVPVEAADPHAQAKGAGTCRNLVDEKSDPAGVDSLPSGDYGTCNDVDCCGGRPRAQCLAAF